MQDDGQPSKSHSARRRSGTCWPENGKLSKNNRPLARTGCVETLSGACRTSKNSFSYDFLPPPGEKPALHEANGRGDGHLGATKDVFAADGGVHVLDRKIEAKLLEIGGLAFEEVGAADDLGLLQTG